MKGVYIKDLNPNLFLFQFFYELDLQRVVASGLWTFDSLVTDNTKIRTGYGSAPDIALSGGDLGANLFMYPGVFEVSW